jgi:FlaG/FlaF family flagellin (archaellin)
MVVITVIIAAVLAVFAFGIGAPTKAPQTQLKFVMDVTGTTFTISNTGGDTLILKDEKITVTNAVTGGAALIDSTLLAIPGLAPGGTTTLPAGKSITAIVAGAVGNVLRIQVLDMPTGQLIADTKVTAV